MNVTASRAEMLVAASKHEADITAIEDLISEGARVVFRINDNAAVLHRVWKRMIEEPVRRVAPRWAKSIPRG